MSNPNAPIFTNTNNKYHVFNKKHQKSKVTKVTKVTKVDKVIKVIKVMINRATNTTPIPLSDHNINMVRTIEKNNIIDIKCPFCQGPERLYFGPIKKFFCFQCGAT